MPHIFELVGYGLIPALAIILAGAWATCHPMKTGAVRSCTAPPV